MGRSLLLPMLLGLLLGSLRPCLASPEEGFTKARAFLRSLERSLPDASSAEGRLLLHLSGEGELFHGLAACLADPDDDPARRRWLSLCKKEGLWSWVGLLARREESRQGPGPRTARLRALAAWKGGHPRLGLRRVEEALAREPWNRSLHRARCKLRRALAPPSRPRMPLGDLASFRRAARREWALRRGERLARALALHGRDCPMTARLELRPGNEDLVLGELERAGLLPPGAGRWKGSWVSGPAAADGELVVVDLHHGLRGRNVAGGRVLEAWPLHLPRRELLVEALMDEEEAVAALAAEGLLQPGPFLSQKGMRLVLRRMAGWTDEGRGFGLSALIGRLRCHSCDDRELARSLQALERSGSSGNRALARWARAWVQGPEAPVERTFHRHLAGTPLLAGERFAPDQWALAEAQ